MMEKWVLAKMEECVIDRIPNDRKIRKGILSFKKPIFHYSTTPLLHG
jgi:hypothetical protein